jgi:hypothetical protein
MHACLIHDHVRALLYLMLIFMGIGHIFVRAPLFIQRPIVVMLTSSIRQYSFSFCGCLNGRGSLTDSFT